MPYARAPPGRAVHPGRLGLPRRKRRQRRRPGRTRRIWRPADGRAGRTRCSIASALDVGLPKGQMGNSEVGHMNIGAGRVVMQDLPRIDKAIADGIAGQQPGAARPRSPRLKASGGTCHLMGLMSPGGVHSHQDHMAALAARARRSRRAGRRSTPSSTAATRRRRARAAISRRFVRRHSREPGAPHRHRQRPLLRHGPRQALGARGAGL